MEEQPFTFRVIDLKQYVYCPRILYYQTALPQVRPFSPLFLCRLAHPYPTIGINKSSCNVSGCAPSPLRCCSSHW
jgi:hypothetical protein